MLHPVFFQIAERTENLLSPCSKLSESGRVAALMLNAFHSRRLLDDHIYFSSISFLLKLSFRRSNDSSCDSCTKNNRSKCN